MRWFNFDSSLTTSSNRRNAWLNSLFIDHAIFRLVWTNFHVVIPGKVYRCNHPTPKRLASLVKQYHIKTVINLRGHRHCGSDMLSRLQSKHSNLIHLDFPFESRGAPHRDRILRFAEAYKSFQFPILIHCKSGADRAGLVSGLITLLEGGQAKQALQQLSWKYGHFKNSKTGILDAFFIEYMKQATHEEDFLTWIEQDYNEQALRKQFKAKKLSSFIIDHLLHRE